jgi:hypothetical protein
LKSHLEIKNPAASPPIKAKTIISIHDHVSIIILSPSLSAAVVLAVICSYEYCLTAFDEEGHA